MKKKNNKCEECYKNGKKPSDIDCKKCDEVIIDGVNVAECNMKCKDGDCALYYAELSNDNNELIYGFNCEDNPDCYYKQLQRAKAENDKLKAEIEDYKEAIYEFNGSAFED